ncbi:RNA polymerase sigma factor [Amycolatopsis sp. NPDC049868]|uniref:RNA polymerase sigma factor n=1 Tax=Amycolatopsis sp. NPDC049868 TaxID=3363934 RepID=UPI003789DFE7
MSEHEPDEAPPTPVRPARPPTPGTEDDITAAFTAFYRDVVKQLVGFLVLQGAQLADAVDLTQDTLSKAYQRWPDLEHPRAWAFRVASRALVRAIASIPEDPVPEIPEPSPLLRTDADLDHWEQQHDIITALDHLPPRQRQVMAWTIYDHTPTEIAHALGIEPAAVRANLKKARRALAANPPGRRTDHDL